MNKQCCKCKKEKPIRMFYKDKSKQGGLHPMCKDCDSIAGKAYRAKNKEKIRERDKKYRLKNKEKIREMKKRYYYEGGGKEKEKQWSEKNKDKLNAQWRARYKKNPEKYLNKHKEYLKKNPEKYKEYKKREYWKYRDKYLAYSNQYRKDNKEKINKRVQKGRDELWDTYLKKLIVGENSNLSHKDIPKKLIDAKRQHLKLKRIIRKEYDEK